MSFPEYRARRIRRHSTLRRLVAETRLHPAEFIAPLYIVEGRKRCEPLPMLPECQLYSADQLSEPGRRLASRQIGGVLLQEFHERSGQPLKESIRHDGPIPRAIKELKAIGSLVVMSEISLSGYGPVDSSTTHNALHAIGSEAALEVMTEIAVSHAKAGVDAVIAGDMIDGAVAVIRETLDEEGFEEVLIVGQSVKYASALYRGTSEALENRPHLGERRGYEMDLANVREAIREVTLDVEEGADMILVKPALTSLDVIAHIRDEFDLPLVAFSASGEYAMVKAAAKAGVVDELQFFLELLTSVRRAGADMIVTHWAEDAAGALNS